MRWRAFYADGRRYDSSVVAWRDLPVDGMVVAVWWDQAGTRHLECGDDALVNTAGAIVGVNLPTLHFEDAAAIEAALGWLKYGVRMEPEAWAAVRAEADEARTPPEP